MVRSTTTLTAVDSLGIGVRTNEFDISKVNESLIGLNIDKQRRTTASGDDLIGEVNGLEDKRSPPAP